MKTKHLISLAEGVIFVFLIIFTLLAIFDLLSKSFTDILEIFSLLSVRLSLIFLVFFLVFPYSLVYLKKLGDKAMVKYDQQKFKDRFFEVIKGSRTIDIIELSKKFDVNLVYIRNFLRDQLAEGTLKGELRGDLFHVEEGFKIMSSKERRITFMKNNIGKFIAAHRSVKLKELSSNFKVPKNILKEYLIKMVDEGKLRGCFEGDTFVRDLSIPEEVECPKCGERFKLESS